MHLDSRSTFRLGRLVLVVDVREDSSAMRRLFGGKKDKPPPPTLIEANQRLDERGETYVPRRTSRKQPPEDAPDGWMLTRARRRNAGWTRKSGSSTSSLRGTVTRSGGPRDLRKKQPRDERCRCLNRSVCTRVKDPSSTTSNLT